MRWLDPERQRPIFGGETAEQWCTRAIGASQASRDLGDLAILGWAAAALGHPGAPVVLERALSIGLAEASPFSVHLAWLLSALVADAAARPREAQARQVAHRLLHAFDFRARVFAHRAGEAAPGLRAHVACFADQVYPIQALARLHRRFGAQRGLEAANGCAARICETQGPAGQWWWHYDARTGAVVEGYPVYSVHQDAMGPMCLLDLEEAGGDAHPDAIRRGLGWMLEAPEIGHSLLDDEADVIWRKVGRREPGKAMRALRAASSRLRGGLRLGFLDPLFPARRVDWESRPYHLGWVLDTWLDDGS